MGGGGKKEGKGGIGDRELADIGLTEGKCIGIRTVGKNNWSKGRL